MIHQINFLHIDHHEWYEGEYSFNMELPKIELDLRVSSYIKPEIKQELREIKDNQLAEHIRNILGTQLNNEVNFYKLLIKRLHTVKQNDPSN